MQYSIRFLTSKRETLPMLIWKTICSDFRSLTDFISPINFVSCLNSLLLVYFFKYFFLRNYE